MSRHRIRVGPLPAWLDALRLLGPTSTSTLDWYLEIRDDGSREAEAELDADAAADLAARLRNLGFDGRAIECCIDPPLRRNLVRRGRSEDARRRRATTAGFERRGTRVDEVGRMSLTPECLALRVAGWAEGRPIVDAGCGVGGNAIAFARSGSSVVAIDSNAERLALARHNAGVYGVADRIHFIHGDALELAAEHADDRTILFCDPPWGADWDRKGCGLSDFPLLAGLLGLADRYAALWAKLPPSFASAELLDGHTGRVDALFGEAEGDLGRVKFVLVRLTSSCA